MKSKIRITLLMVIMSGCLQVPVQAQPNLLNGPEGIAFYSPQKAWYVTNAEDGKIIKIDSLGNQSIFWEGINIPIGIEAIGDSIYISSNEPYRVTCISIPDSTKVYHLTLSSVYAVSHMDYDPRTGFLYLVNQYGGLIKINICRRTYSIFVPVGSGIPGGSQTVITDTAFNLLYIFSWPQTPVRSVNMNDSTDIDILFNPGISQFIASTTDMFGYMYVSSWWTDRIYRYPPHFDGNPVVFSTGHVDPAGMAVNPFDEVIAVCNWGDNTVDFISITTGSDELPGFSDLPVRMICYPNPCNDQVTISFDACGKKRSLLVITDTQGHLVARRQLEHSAAGVVTESIPMGPFAAGRYQVYLFQDDLLAGQRTITKVPD